MPSLLVVQHDHVSPPGPVAERFAERGYDVTEHVVVPADRFEAPDVEPAFPAFADHDAVVTMGARWSAYDDLAIGSWVGAEREQLRAADAAGVPVLGICFGGQLLAAAHGGSVAAAPEPEVGWRTVASDAEDVVPSGEWFSWHFDRWALPPGATELARTPAASQAFVLRRNLAVQFHPELTPVMLAGWLAHGGAAAVRAHGLDPDELLDRTRDREPAARERAHRLVDGFLDRVAGRTG